MSGTWCTFCGKTDCWDAKCAEAQAYLKEQAKKDAGPVLYKALRTIYDRLGWDMPIELASMARDALVEAEKVKA